MGHTEMTPGDTTQGPKGLWLVSPGKAMSGVIWGEWETSNLKLCSLITYYTPGPSPELHRNQSLLSVQPSGQIGN